MFGFNLLGRTRPCMLYQIKRCSAPCVDLINETDYAALVKDSVDFLEGKSVELQDRLAAEMREAAEQLEFEHAARLRNRIRALASVRAAQGINPSTFTEADVFALHSEGGQSCIQVFFFRAGQNWGNRAYFPRHGAEETTEDILSAFIAQFYDDREPPKLILTSIDPSDRELLEEALCVRAECKVEICRPSAAKSVRLSMRPCSMRAKLWAGAWPRPAAWRSCWMAWRKCSACRNARSGLKSTTTATSKARMRWAR
ncbi:MAG: UvrB/UvrC motif-containing protein [Hyphomonadaceae bacterium]